MKIIFLDIDGVLNTQRHVINQYISNGHRKTVGMDRNFDPICLKYLKEIIEKTDAHIVISSTWRFWAKNPTHYRWQAILENLGSIGIADRIVGTTEILGTTRGVEIREWLKKNDVESFVILDDDRDMEEFTEKKLAKCNFKTGITEVVKNKAIKILNRVI